MKNIERWAKKLCTLAAESERCLDGLYSLTNCSECELNHVCADPQKLYAYMMKEAEEGTAEKKKEGRKVVRNGICR